MVLGVDYRSEFFSISRDVAIATNLVAKMEAIFAYLIPYRTGVRVSQKQRNFIYFVPNFRLKKIATHIDHRQFITLSVHFCVQDDRRDGTRRVARVPLQQLRLVATCKNFRDNISTRLYINNISVFIPLFLRVLLYI